LYFWFYFFLQPPTRLLFFFAVHTNFMLQPDSIIHCKQAQQNNWWLAHTADYYPFLFFNLHGNNVATRQHYTLQTSATK
jgi:hypothetical protein